jgi:hypothetical protein
VSGICRELRDRYRAFRARNLGAVRLLALFLDAIYLPVRPEGPKEGVLVAWGFTTDGDRVLLDVCLGQRERTEDWTELGRGLTRRGLRVVELLLRGSSASPPAWKTGGVVNGVAMVAPGVAVDGDAHPARTSARATTPRPRPSAGAVLGHVDAQPLPRLKDLEVYAADEPPAGGGRPQWSAAAGVSRTRAIGRAVSFW